MILLRKRRIISGILIVFLAVFLLCAVDSRLEITKYSLEYSSLPKSFDGFKIVHLSDVHAQGNEKLLSKVASLNPDIIAVTGDDIEQNTDEEKRKAVSFMSELKKIAPVYAVSGNHDNNYSPDSVLSDEYEKIGINYLENEKAVIKKGNEQIEIAGICDPTIAHFEPELEQKILDEYKTIVKPDGFSVLLYHRADMFDMLKDEGYSLILSGHLHGGQIRIPFVGGLVSPVRKLFPKYSGGKYEESGTVLISSRGIAKLDRVPRVLNRPEVICITLNCK